MERILRKVERRTRGLSKVAKDAIMLYYTETVINRHAAGESYDEIDASYDYANLNYINQRKLKEEVANTNINDGLNTKEVRKEQKLAEKEQVNQLKADIKKKKELEKAIKLNDKKEKSVSQELETTNSGADIKEVVIETNDNEEVTKSKKKSVLMIVILVLTSPIWLLLGVLVTLLAITLYLVIALLAVVSAASQVATILVLIGSIINKEALANILLLTGGLILLAAISGFTVAKLTKVIHNFNKFMFRTFNKIF